MRKVDFWAKKLFFKIFNEASLNFIQKFYFIKYIPSVLNSALTAWLSYGLWLLVNNLDQVILLNQNH